MKPLILVPPVVKTADMGKVNDLVREFIHQVKLANPTAPNELGAAIGGFLSCMCQLYDVQAARDLTRKLVNSEAFWKEQAKIKRLALP